LKVDVALNCLAKVQLSFLFTKKCVLFYTFNSHAYSVCTYDSSGTKSVSHLAFNIQTGRQAVSHTAIDGRSLAVILCELGGN